MVLLHKAGWCAGALKSSTDMFCQDPTPSTPSNDSQAESGSQNSPGTTSRRQFACSNPGFCSIEDMTCLICCCLFCIQTIAKLAAHSGILNLLPELTALLHCSLPAAQGKSVPKFDAQLGRLDTSGVESVGLI